MRWTLLYYLLAFQLLFFQVSSAPTPPKSLSDWQASWKPGDYVGVFPSAYYEGPQTHQNKPMHPGVVVSKDEEEGKFKVAIISHRHPPDQPQKSIKYFDEETKVDGNVDLGHPKVVERTKMKPWRDGQGMGYTKPMSEGNLEKLKQALGTTTPTGGPTGSSQHGQANTRERPHDRIANTRKRPHDRIVGHHDDPKPKAPKRLRGNTGHHDDPVLRNAPKGPRSKEAQYHPSVKRRTGS